MDALLNALQVADWRRRMFGLYASVRELAEHDPVASHELWRTTRDDLFREHPASPLLPDERAEFTGLPVAAYDPAWRFAIPIVAAVEPLHVDVETGTDGVVPFDLLGVAPVPGVGSLDVWRLASYGGGLFLPLKDGLAGKPGGTYGGGRYLLDTVKGAYLGAAEGTIILDFNFAYNPSCAYDPMWACPLPRGGNTVGVDVPVGERFP